MQQVGWIAGFVLTVVWLLPWADRMTERRPIGRRVLQYSVFSVYVLANLRETLLFRKVLSQIDVRLIPLKIHTTMIAKIADQAAQGAVNWNNLRGLEEICLNILLYVPLGYLLPWIWPRLRTARLEGRHSTCFQKYGSQRRQAWLSGRVMLVGAICTLATELIQLTARIGIFEVDDLINNILGCVIGCVLYELAIGAAKIWNAKGKRALRME